MRALFPPWTNSAFRVAIVLFGVGTCGATVAPMVFVRMPWGTGQGDPPLQPVGFDHRHHVQDDGIDCRYCHPDAATSENAGIPSTEVCMGCHSQVWPDSPSLALVRKSHETNEPIRWTRVNALPDFVYFDHSIHVTGGGVACSSCHGAVETMARVYQDKPLTMGWCLDCHRQRAPQKTFCSACHR